MVIYKAGDRVKAIDNFNSDFLKGELATVVTGSVYSNGLMEIVPDKVSILISVFPDEIELISSSKDEVKAEIIIAKSNNLAVVNDYICPTCKNNRCSKSEKTCWKCGNPL